jgi:hypothetical protein
MAAGPAECEVGAGKRRAQQGFAHGIERSANLIGQVLP